LQGRGEEKPYKSRGSRKTTTGNLLKTALVPNPSAGQKPQGREPRQLPRQNATFGTSIKKAFVYLKFKCKFKCFLVVVFWFVFLVGLGFEFWASYLQSRCSTT
jgi:hypothetical protein